MVIIEGPDGAGKSTLVNHLAEKYALDIGKRGTNNRDLLYTVTRQDTYRALSNAVLGKLPVEIWDRLFISEFVYHDIAPRRPCEFGDAEAQWIEGVIDIIGCPVILCLPPLKTVMANASKVHQMPGVDDALWKIYRRYAAQSLPWPDRVMTYDYTGQQQGDSFSTLKDVEEEIEGYLETRKARQAWN